MQVIITFEHMLAKRLKFMDTMVKRHEEKLKAKELQRQIDFENIIARNHAERLYLYRSLAGKPCHYCKDECAVVLAAVPLKHQHGEPRQFAPICPGCLDWHNKIFK